MASFDTIKSIVQDWLAECHDTKTLAKTYAEIRVLLDLQFNKQLDELAPATTTTPVDPLNPYTWVVTNGDPSPQYLYNKTESGAVNVTKKETTND